MTINAKRDTKASNATNVRMDISKISMANV